MCWPLVNRAVWVCNFETATVSGRNQCRCPGSKDCRTQHETRHSWQPTSCGCKVQRPCSTVALRVSIDVRYGVTANIAAFHAAARGSIPRIGVFFSCEFSAIETFKHPHEREHFQSKQQEGFYGPRRKDYQNPEWRGATEGIRKKDINLYILLPILRGYRKCSVR